MSSVLIEISSGDRFELANIATFEETIFRVEHGRFQHFNEIKVLVKGK